MKQGKLPKEQFMSAISGYTLDMHKQGELVRAPKIDLTPGKDHGADPIGDGTFRMVPSGNIVDYEERCKRLSK